MMFIGMMMFLVMFFRLFLSIFFVEKSFEWFLMLDLFHGIFIDYIHDFGLVCILFSMLEYWYKSQHQSQKQE